MSIRWTPTALADLQAVHAYITADNVEAADKFVHVLKAIAALEAHPHMGRSGRVPGTRELVARPYVIAYRVERAAVELLAIIHGARRWPEAL